MTQKKIAFIYTWPNSKFKNAEYEVLKRIEIAAKNIKLDLDIISGNGFILDKEYFETKTKINEKDYLFMVSVHYDDIKKLDIFSYYTLWVPPEITMQYETYGIIKKNILSMDDFIIHDDGGMYGHLKTLLYDTERNIDNAQFLTASMPVSTLHKPILKNPRLFYCGINWEKLIGKKKGRHSELFKYFNKYEHIDIYGPKSTWKGNKKYKGTIPFDGVTILDKINEAGIVLALSSDAHWRAGSATNRIYEGCAGGAVIISDTNPFIIKHFGDSVLYFDYDTKHPEKMFSQIKKHVEWIRNNPEKAKKLAEKSQEIWLEQYSLEEQLKQLVNKHKEREDYVASILHAKNQNKKVLAILMMDTKLFDEVDKVIIKKAIKNIERQKYKNIILTIACDTKLKKDINNYIETLQTNVDYKLYDFDIYDDFENKHITRGQMTNIIMKELPHDYLLFLLGNEYLFKDHITSLIRIFENNKDTNLAAVYSGQISEKKDGMIVDVNYAYRSISSLIKYSKNNAYASSSSSFLLNAEIEKFIPDYVYENIDGLEFNALTAVAVLKHKYNLEFSKRMSNRIEKSINLKNNYVIPIKYQMNLISGLVVWELEIMNTNTINNIDLYKEVQRNRLLKRYLTFKIFLQNIALCFIFLHPSSKQRVYNRKKRYEEVKNSLFYSNDVEI